MSRPHTVIETLARLGATRSRPTRPNRTGRWRGTRRPSSSSEASGGGERGVRLHLRRRGRRPPRRRQAARRRVRAATPWTSGGAGEAMLRALSATSAGPASCSMRHQRRRHRPLGPEGAAARASRSSTLLGRGARRRSRSTAAAASPRYADAHCASSSAAGSRRASRAVKMKVGREPERDRDRVRIAREAIGSRRRPVRRRQRRLRPQAGAREGAPFRRRRRELVRGAGLLGRSRRAAAAPRPRSGRHGDRRGRIRVRLVSTSGACWRPARSTSCRPTPPAAAASPDFCEAAALCRRVDRCPCPPTPRPACTATSAARVLPVRHLEYFHDHVRIERDALRRRACRRRTGCCVPDRSRPGLGLAVKRADAERTPSGE